jgi:hypothetical protein
MFDFDLDFISVLDLTFLTDCGLFKILFSLTVLLGILNSVVKLSEIFNSLTESLLMLNI